MASKKVKKTTKPSKKEPQTMADLLASSKTKVKGFSVSDKVKAKVVAKNPKSLVLDIGGKSEGLVAEKAFIEARNLIKTLKVGDEVLATVIVSETKEGTTILSLRHAANRATWEKLEKSKKEGKEISVKGKSASKSGVMVEFNGMYGFVPASQMGKHISNDLQSLVDKNFKVKIIELNKKANKIVLSEKQVSEAKEIERSKEVLKKIQEGEIYDGKVITITNFGCFVKLNLKDEETNIEGLVHISEISWDKVGKVSDVLEKGDTVKVKVLEKTNGRLSLSIKQAQKDPWEDVAKNYKPEAKFKGKVVKISDFGAFVQIEPGLEGLVHITKIPPATRLKKGDEIECYIEEINKDDKKISLGLVLTTKPVGYK